MRLQANEYIGGVLETKAIAYMEFKGFDAYLNDCNEKSVCKTDRVL